MSEAKFGRNTGLAIGAAGESATLVCCVLPAVCGLGQGRR